MTSNGSLIRLIGKDTCLLGCGIESTKSARAVDVLNNKVVLLYFSSHLCPRTSSVLEHEIKMYPNSSCRHFTPKLLSLYEKLKAKEGAVDFELVYCSWDKSESEYQQSSRCMPCWRLPYRSPLVRKLASYYECRGIPHLVVLDSDGGVILNDGVDAASNDPDGSQFPWRPRPFVDLLPTHYIASDKTTRRPMDELNQNYLMLYFSAFWCPPCQSFTPKLSNAYRELKSQENNFELLFVSSDYEPEAFEAYFQTMSFGALPFEDRNAKESLSARLGVRSIPTLVMLGPVDAATGGDRPVINQNVRPIIEHGDYLIEFPFHPKLYGDLNRVQENINSIRAVVVFHECGDDNEHGEIHKTVQRTAELSSGNGAMRFYWATESTILTRTVREALRLGTTLEPRLVMLDFPDGGSFYVCESQAQITVDTILEFLSNPGERNQM